MVPATAGQILTPEDLRTYGYCSEYHHFGGRRQLNPVEQLCQAALESLLADSLRTNTVRTDTFAKHALRAVRLCNMGNQYLDGQVDAWYHQAILWLNDFFSLFEVGTYHPVAAGLPWRVRVNKTPIDVRISGVLRTTKNQTLHVLLFTPFDTHLDRANDPVVPLLLETMQSLVKPHASKRAQVRLHLLGYRPDPENRLLYTSMDTNELSPQAAERTKNIVKALEAGLHWPILPCRNSGCQFAARCPARKQ